jgi:hypothetical protein
MVKADKIKLGIVFGIIVSLVCVIVYNMNVLGTHCSI